MVLFAAAAILAVVSPALASHYGDCKWCVSKRAYVRSPVCRTVKEPIALRHGYLIYLPHEICH
jgi:hypothetical protein